jgi:hypothetical protein
MRTRAGALAVAANLALAFSAPSGAAERLGTVSSPISCNAAAQERFARAVAILHSFWYEEAERAFTAVAEADPACAMAAIPARYAVERQSWAEAAKLGPPKAAVAWSKYPWTTAMIVYPRALGDAHTGDLAGAKGEIEKLAATRDALRGKSKYWSDQVRSSASLRRRHWPRPRAGTKGPA